MCTSTAVVIKGEPARVRFERRPVVTVLATRFGCEPMAFAITITADQLHNRGRLPTALLALRLCLLQCIGEAGAILDGGPVHDQ